MDSMWSPPEPAPIRILCVEDNDADFDLVEEYLSLAPNDLSYELTRAKRVDDACRQLAARSNDNTFDVILADLSLPDSRAEATFHALQQAAPLVAITVLTGLEDRDLELELVKQGAQDFLPKDELGPTFLLRSILHSIERKRIGVEMEKLNADLKSAQLQLIQAEKLESLGRLSTGVAHEIKNPLAMLQACVDFYVNRFRFGNEIDESERAVLETMQEAIDRATKIVGGMLDFSRNQTLELKFGDLNTLARRSGNLVEPDLNSKGIKIIWNLDPGLPRVRFDPAKIEQVLINLLVNAMDASPAGGRIQLRTYTGELGFLLRDEGLRTLEHLRVGDEVAVVEIRDYGCGIPKDKTGKIFDPFFTTKATGKGTGLGLSVSKTILDLHGGMLRIKNVDPPGVRAQVILRSGTTVLSKMDPAPSSPTPEP